MDTHANVLELLQKVPDGKMQDVESFLQGLIAGEEDTVPGLVLTDDEKIDVVARRILKRHKAAFMELAK